MRLIALVLALALLLSGCGTPADDPGGADGSNSENPPETLSDTSTPPNDGDGESGRENGEEDADGESSGENSGEGDDGNLISQEDQVLLERCGLTEDVTLDISKDDATEINRASASMFAAYVAGPDGEDPIVKSRDWSIYTSPFGREKLSVQEAVFYDKLDKCCEKYLSTSAADGVKYNRNGTIYYSLEGVDYGSSGLTGDQAGSLYFWFRFNHPQYYFLSGRTLRGENKLYPVIYETMSDAEERAEITNELFDKLDGWVQQVKDGGANTYEREILANNMLCVENVYKQTYIGELRADQSLYSSIMMGTTVCAGYALAFCAMMNAMDIDTTVGLSSNHAWNVVRFDDGNFYAVDVCWNDTDSEPAYKHDYLNIGEAIIQASNSRKEAHTYGEDLAAWIPAIAKNSYVPTSADYGIELTAPQNVQVTEDANNLYFTWDEVPNADRYQFETYRGDDYSDFSNFMGSDSLTQPKCTRLKKADDPSKRPQELAPGTTYYFRIRAIHEADGKSLYSDWTCVPVTTASDDSSQGADDGMKLAAPTDIRAQSIYTTHALISWSPVSDATGYDVYVYEDENHSGEPQTMQVPAKRTLDLRDLKKGTTYYLIIRSVKEENGQTIYSDWVEYAYTHAGRD